MRPGGNMYHSECNMQSLTHKNRNCLIHECKDLKHEIYNTTHKRTEINKNTRGTTQKYGRTNRTETTHTYAYIYIYYIYNIHILGRSWNEQTTSTNTKLEHHLPPRHFSKLRAKVTPAAAQAAASYAGLSPKS